MPPTHDPKRRTPEQREQERNAYHDRRRAKAKPWRKWYHTTAWKALRVFVLARDPMCVRCLPKKVLVPSTTVNHIVRHDGDWSLFIDQENCEGVCKLCHDSEIQREERKAPPIPR